MSILVLNVDRTREKLNFCETVPERVASIDQNDESQPVRAGQRNFLRDLSVSRHPGTC